MYRDILTNKWVLGSIGFLIVFAVGCYFWYQHDTAPDRKAAAEAQELLRQWEIAKKASKTGNKVKQAADGTAADSITPIAEKQRTNKNLVTKDIQPTHAQTHLSTENAETAEVRVSPHGFGPYPEIPEDYPSKHLIEWDKDGREMELLNRVLIKLWTSGEKNFLGGSTHDGKIYPHYYDTVYIGIKETRTPGGAVTRVTNRLSGPFVRYTLQQLEENPPPHIRILDLETSGIDPYQYLDLP